MGKEYHQARPIFHASFLGKYCGSHFRVVTYQYHYSLEFSMPNLSVKLDEATRQRLLQVATDQGITPHAFMVKAIGAELAQAEAEAAFVARALAARAQVIATGQAIDGPAFADYLRCRVRGQPALRLSAQAIAECVETRA